MANNIIALGGNWHSMIGRAVDLAHGDLDVLSYDAIVAAVKDILLAQIEQAPSARSHCIRVPLAFRSVRYEIESDISSMENGSIFRIDQLAINILAEGPKGIEVGEHFFRFSNEVRQGMAGRRGDDHRIDPSALAYCLGKKNKKKIFQRCIQNGIKREIDLYFSDRSGYVLHVVVKYFPEGKFPFIIVTAYYMADSSAKSRFGLQKHQAGFNRLFKGLPTAEKSSDCG